uniref:Uncharacterized protein n=1 Tax=Podoviridae sp. ctYMC43 TaxID=2827619 RepID=A0A8S5LPQ0_9CAUD|nr:MAG TPA: hypothetical protein [Podoviridae sp. ctYMC43]
MPNLVLEKGGQTFRFGLHENKGVTRGKFITVPYNGKDYYARYGDTPTPLKVEKDGRTYSIQYEPVEFTTYSWAKNGRRNGAYEENVFLPNGKYRVTYTYQYKSSNNRDKTGTDSEEFTMNTSQEVPIKVEYNQEGVIHRIWVTIQNAYNGYQNRLYGDISFTIERIGE